MPVGFVGGLASLIALVQHVGETLTPPHPEVRRDLHLIGKFWAIVRPQPRGQRTQCRRVLSDFLGEGQGQIARDCAGLGCFAEQPREMLRFEEVL